MKLSLALSLIAVGDAFIFSDTRILSRTVSTKSNGGDIELLRGPPARTNVAFVLHASTEIPEDTSDVDEKKALLAQINELASAFEQVQATIQSNTRLYEQKMDDYEDDIEKLKSEINKQITGIMTRDYDIKELNGKLEAAESQLQDENLSSSKLEDNIKMLQSEIQTLKEDVGINDGEVGQLKGDLDCLKQELEKKETEFKQLSTSSSAMDEEKKSLSSRIQELEGDMNRRMKLEDEISEYKSNVESMKKSIDAQKEIIVDKDEEIRKINAVVEALQNDLDTVKGNDGKWQQEVDLAKAKLEKNEALWQKEKIALMAEKRKASEEVEIVQNEWNDEKNALVLEKNAILKEKVAIKLQLSNFQLEAEQAERLMKGRAEDLERSLREINMGDTQLRNEIANIRSKSHDELMDVQLKYEQTEKLNEFKIQNLEKNAEQYEEERRSFRKLTGLWMSSIFRRGKKTNDGSGAGTRLYKRNLK